MDRLSFKKLRAVWRLWRPRWREFKLRALRLFMRFVPGESQRVFILTLIVGAACGLAAVSFHLAISWAEELMIDRALKAPGSSWMWLGVITPAVGGLVGGLMLAYLVPGARGSGIPQVKVAYAVKGGRIPLRDTVGKFVLSALQIGSGGSLGREGPTVHICAGIAAALGRTFALSQKNLKRLLPVGAAAGIAAAFNAPIAAVTFTIEEVVGDLDQTVLSGVIVAAAIAAAIERGILGEHPVFTVTETFGLHYASSIILYAVLGVLAGFVSLAFTESLLGVRMLFRRMTVVPVWAQPAVGGALTGVLIVAAIYFLQTGGINGGGYDVLDSALSGKLAFKVMAALCVVKLAATVFSYSSGGAGGIFAPSLFIGGMLGGVVGYFDTSLLGHPSSQLGAFALVGMGAVFAGIVRAPITSVLIIFEMTGSYGLILPLMIANMTSYALARRFRHTPIYEALLVQDDIFLPHPSRSTAHALERLQVSQAMNTDPVVLRTDMTVREAAEFVQRYEFTTFPIVDAESNCAGSITEMRLRRNLVEKQAERPIVEIADECRSVRSDEPLADAVLLMHETRVRQLAVTDHATAAKLVGIITMSDIVRVQAETMKSIQASK